jgi:hypothetical protein
MLIVLVESIEVTTPERSDVRPAPNKVRESERPSRPGLHSTRPTATNAAIRKVG